MENRKNKYSGIAYLIFLLCIFSIGFQALAETRRTSRDKQNPTRVRETNRSTYDSHEVNILRGKPVSPSVPTDSEVSTAAPPSETPESERTLEIKAQPDGSYQLTGQASMTDIMDEAASLQAQEGEDVQENQAAMDQGIEAQAKDAEGQAEQTESAGQAMMKGAEAGAAIATSAGLEQEKAGQMQAADSADEADETKQNTKAEDQPQGKNQMVKQAAPQMSGVAVGQAQAEMRAAETQQEQSKTEAQAQQATASAMNQGISQTEQIADQLRQETTSVAETEAAMVQPVEKEN